MAQIDWVSNSGNWTSGASWSTGVEPTATDTVHFRGSRSQVSAISNLSAVTFAKLYVWQDFRGNIGSPGSLFTPVTIGADIQHKGTGTIYAGTFDNSGQYMLVDSSNLVDAVQFMGTTLPAIVLHRGGAIEQTLTNPSPIDRTLWHITENGRTSRLVLRNIIGQDIYMDGGFVSVFGSITNLTMAGGEYVQQISSNSDYPATIQVFGGSFRGLAGSGSSINLLVAARGTVDWSGLQGTLTITECIIYPGCFYVDNPLITYTRKIDLREDVPALP